MYQFKPMPTFTIACWINDVDLLIRLDLNHLRAALPEESALYCS
jgi:hypothetical protein